MKATPRVLAVDIGGTNVKILTTGEAEPRKFASGKNLTPSKAAINASTTIDLTRSLYADLAADSNGSRNQLITLNFPG